MNKESKIEQDIEDAAIKAGKLTDKVAREHGLPANVVSDARGAAIAMVCAQSVIKKS